MPSFYYGGPAVQKGKVFTPTRLAERVGQAIGQIGPVFTIQQIRSILPDLPWQRVYRLLQRKEDQDIIEKIGQAQYQLLQEPFVRQIPTGVIAQATWKIMYAHRQHTLTSPEVALECIRETGLPSHNVRKAVGWILSIWYQNGALTRTGNRRGYYYRLKKHIRTQPLTSLRKRSLSAAA